MLNVQTYLLNHSLSDLKINHGINFRWSLKNPNKISLNYDQLEAKDDDILAQECRGLVLKRINGPCSDDVVFGNSIVFARPMNRFFNFGQSTASKIDVDSISFFEKLDGTNSILYFDQDLKKWSMATRSVPDADLFVDGTSYTFRDLFDKALEYETVKSSSLFYYKLDTNLTYIFELCTPYNQIVVPYRNFQLFLLAVRNTVTGEEYNIEDFKHLTIPLAPKYNLNSLNEMISFVNSRNPSEHEGIVICDKFFNRNKVKNPAYMALNKIRDSVAKSPRAMLEVILLEKEDDIIPMLPPALQSDLLSLKEKYISYISYTEKLYKELYHNDRKTFALRIKEKCPYNMSYFMSRYMNKVSSLRKWINSHKINNEWPNSILDNLLELMQKQS